LSTLPLSHGFPVRLVVPQLRSYKNAKYLARIENTDHLAALGCIPLATR